MLSSSRRLRRETLPNPPVPDLITDGGPSSPFFICITICLYLTPASLSSPLHSESSPSTLFSSPLILSQAAVASNLSHAGRGVRQGSRGGNIAMSPLLNGPFPCSLPLLGVDG
ncbi:unnamed protein product [Pleuronectes platessa]|uniref:Uncharacterized protein n=1 Tax=Pleuronectes platessa TaxID=8262 RepID=A0A9N7TPM4_PLEPL|nr:unnamed protein product [Pleuronectes platessa]